VSAPKAGHRKPDVEAVLRPSQALLANNKQDITRTDNIYTQIKQPLARIPSLLLGIKSCLPFMIMSVGYAELFNRKCSIISVFRNPRMQI
jgi:hypothetical protein